VQVNVVLQVLTPDGSAICGVERTDVIVTTADGETNIDRAQVKLDELIKDAHGAVRSQMREFREQLAQEEAQQQTTRPGRRLGR
jgi:hypothetical protein